MPTYEYKIPIGRDAAGGAGASPGIWTGSGSPSARTSRPFSIGSVPRDGGSPARAISAMTCEPRSS